MYPKWIIIFFTLAILASCKSYAQIGTDFWFVAPSVTSGHSDNPVYFRISSYSLPATVTISQPANTNFTPLTLTLLANQTKSIDLTSSLFYLENTPADVVLNYGIHVESTSNVTVYYEVEGSGKNKDIFTLKAQNALGEHFFIPAQSFWENTQISTPLPTSSFEIVATEDSTSVIITPSNEIIGHAANSSFTIILNKGQTYSATASSHLATDHLHGSEVKSNKPIAITISDDSAEFLSYGYCRDLMGDQIVPLDRIGKEYIVIKGFLVQNWSGLSLDDKVFVTAAYDNTEIYLDGSAAITATLNKGEQYVISLSANQVYIETSKDTYVTHVTGYGCEVGMAILPPINCTGLDEVSFTRTSAEDFYLIILVEQGGENGFSINGDPTLLPGSIFKTVPGTGGQWMMAFKQFTIAEIAVNSTLGILNSNENFHVGVVNGGKFTGCVYGYFSHFGSSIITQPIYHY